jgi:hypothetical protein
MIKSYISNNDLDCVVEVNGKVETEVFTTTPELSIVDVVSKITQFCAESTSYTELEYQLLQKDNEILQLKYKLLENGIR